MADQAVVIGGVAIPRLRFNPPRQLLQRCWGFCYFTGVFVGTRWLADRYGPEFYVIAPAAICLAILFHELGHLAAARLQHFIVTIFIIGPVQVAPRGGRWSVARASNPRLGGFVGAIPRGPHGYRRQWALFLVCAPLANLVTGLAAAVMAFFARSNPMFADALLTYAMISLVFGLQALVPYRTSWMASDGAQLLRLLKGGKWTGYFDLVAEIRRRNFAGERPREWDAPLIEELARVADTGPLDPEAYNFIYLHYADAGDVARAEYYVQRALAATLTIPPITAARYVAVLTWFYARRGEQMDACRDILASLRRFGMKPQALQRLEAAISLADGDYETCRRHVRAVLGRIDHSSETGLVLIDREWLEQLLAKCDEQPVPV
ncbi:MAG TPA: M50 family metallopeptidase [Thermomicrobiaceae bacterium]|nr:M50 family metallopeptidase [Thermomicrobiaceae bacterium]